MAVQGDVMLTGLTRLLAEGSFAQPGSIRRACAGVEDCLSSNRDNLRAFFELCFPVLIRRIFGFDFQKDSWLNVVSKVGREVDVQALMALLSPTGRLFQAILSADADRLVLFSFPVENLPSHTQELLRTPAGRAELERWPQYKGRILIDQTGKAQVQVHLFEYFMFWNAVYVVRSRDEDNTPGSSRQVGPSGGAVGGGVGLPGFRHDMNWKQTFTDLKHNLTRGFHSYNAHGVHTHPYFALLDQYLKHFLPQGRSAADPGNATRALVPVGNAYNPLAGFYSQDSATSLPALGAKLLSILLEFWLTDVGEPLPSQLPATGDPTASAAKLAVMAAGGAQSPGLSPSGASQLGSPAFGVAGGMLGNAAAGIPPAGPRAMAGSIVPGVGNLAMVATTTNPLRTLSFQPPSEEMLQGITQLVRHLIVSTDSTGPGNARGQSSQRDVSVAGPRPAQTSTPWLTETPVRTISISAALQRTGHPAVPAHILGASCSPAVQAVSRKVYRFLRRTIAQWPVSSSMSFVPVVNLWLAMICPWADPNTIIQSIYSKPGEKGMARERSPAPGSTSRGDLSPSSAHKIQEKMSHFGSEISNMLHMVGSRPQQGQHAQHGSVLPSDKAIQACQYGSEWKAHVLSHLPFYSILIPNFLELAYARLNYRSDAAATELLVLLQGLALSGPALKNLLKDAETAQNRFVDSGRRSVSRTFQDVLPWLLEQATDFEAAAVAGAQTNPPIRVDASYRLFSLQQGGAAHAGDAIARAAQTQVKAELRGPLLTALTELLPLQDMDGRLQQRRSEEQAMTVASSVRFPRAGSWSSVQYKGDWLTRPIASNEIGLLVRVTVALSKWLNHMTGLDQPWRGEGAEEPPENVIQQLVCWCRKKQYRISIRFLAEIQVLGWLFLAYLITRMFRALYGA